MEGVLPGGSVPPGGRCPSRWKVSFHRADTTQEDGARRFGFSGNAPYWQEVSWLAGNKNFQTAAMSGKKKEKASVPTTMAIGAFAGAASKTAVAPLERVRLLLQMAPARGEGSRSASSGFSAVMKSEGVVGLWRGNGLSIIRAMLSKGILFSSQDVLAGKLGSDALAGGGAGLLAGGLTYPLDLLRTRLAGTVGGGTSVSRVALDIVRTAGPLALFRGVHATIGGAVTYETMRFGTYGALRDRGMADGVLGPAMCGTAASLLAGNIIYPNDTVRRRLQVGKGAGGSETYLCALRALHAEGGMARLYRGIVLYNIKVAPSAAVQFATFHGLKRLVESRAEVRSVK